MGSPERQSGVSNVDESSSLNGNEPVEKDEGSSSTSSAPNEEHPQLSLIPLHPASKKLHAKQLPIVLGRTDLAAWWWKACPCQHYCRLHCRPVAQNIRSLSKVMIQIDTAARVHIVGKNPHLITITPDRDDKILRENDVISIGRRDREPWMRFQVIRKPEGNGAAPLVVGRQRAATATAAVYSSNQRGDKTEVQKSNNAPNATPPEWITTDSRKRKPSRSSSKSLSSLSNRGAKQQPKQRPPLQQGVDNPQQPTAQEAASAATIARVQMSYVKANHQAAAASNKEAAIAAGGLSPPRKRRRRGTNADTNTSNENSPRRVRRSGSRHNHKSNDAVATDGLERTRSGGNTTGTNTNSNNNVSSSKRDRPHVHLVFQDYQTSASLLEGNEIRRKSESSINQATTRASSAASVVRYHQNGRSTPPRAFLADKSQLRLLSKNFAEALLGAVSPTANEQTVATPVGVGEEIAGSFSNIGTTVKKTSDKPTVAYAAEKTPRSKLLLPSSEEMDNLPQSSASKKFFKAIVGQARDGNSGQILKGDDEDECVSVFPECASSSFEPGQEDLGHSVEESHQTALIQAPVEKTVQTGSKMPRDGSDSSSSSSPAMWDPLLDLQPWQNMMKREEERGNSSSFRHALASLIVAKNQDRVNTSDDKRRRLMWIPSLLGEDFKIEEPEA